MAHRLAEDPAPLSLRQSGALLASAGRELSWGLRELGRQEDRWRARATAIPDPSLRAAALQAHRYKRGNLAGAGMFSILPRRRSPAAIRALAAQQTIFDFLDNANETHTPLANGLQLHLALVDAVDVTRPLADYYALHPARDDDGYLRALVECCREASGSLPSYELLRPLLAEEAWRARQALAMNHLPVEGRDATMRRWAEEEFGSGGEWSWFELCAAASGQLGTFVLLAMAAEPKIDPAEVAATREVYWPLVPLLTTMLDSFVDQSEDTANGEHLYVEHYGGSETTTMRLSALISHVMREVRALPNGHRHAVILGCMVTYYLSKDSARSAEMKPRTVSLVRAGGSIARPLAPILRLWRLAYSQASA